MNMPAVWKELKTEFSLPEEELRASLCRATHFKQGEVATLREREAEVQQWLESRGLQAHKMYQWLTKKQKSSYGKRYAVRREEDRWRTLLAFREQAALAFPEKDVIDLRRAIRRIGRYEYGEIKELRPDEYALRDILLRLKLHPVTLHKWLLRDIVPEDIRKRLESGEITLTNAKTLFTNRERQQRAVLEIQLIETARGLVHEVLA